MSETDMILHYGHIKYGMAIPAKEYLRDKQAVMIILRNGSVNDDIISYVGEYIEKYKSYESEVAFGVSALRQLAE